MMSVEWEKLKKKAVERDRSLGRVKRQFTLVTQGQVAEFQAEVVKWHAEYMRVGPGTGKGTLDEGLEMMQVYGAQLAKHEKTREELGIRSRDELSIEDGELVVGTCTF